ncbi:hypothetical protein [Streptomyces lateritius]|uniref:hypothetical protein n=1 Tax=Streptomyces lateritius TaxID=67313 RepID=UPI001998E6FE|nr:hypothetical protein [Streptomyces lateritius]GGT62498.1 hypothetical protein GCM10010272_00570 [Streptomyces lateritius]
MSSQTEQNTMATAQQHGSHHYVLTLDMPGRIAGTWHGTVTPGPTSTRNDMFLWLRERISSENPEFARANVVFFSLEPNRL